MCTLIFIYCTHVHHCMLVYKYVSSSLVSERNVFNLFNMNHCFKQALAMGRAYLFHHWNQFELLIVIVGIIDVILLNLFASVGSPHDVLSTVTVFRIIRVFRILRLFKVKVSFYHFSATGVLV